VEAAERTSKQPSDRESVSHDSESGRESASTLANTWTVKEVAQFLDVTTDWVYRHARLGHLPGNRPSARGHWRFDPEQIRRYIRGEWSPKAA
jgi:excisionase family DNA binding protein